MSTLKEYLWRNRFRMKAHEFADRLGIEKTYLSAVSNGRSMPSVQLAKAIQQETNGEVLWHDLIDWCERTKAEYAAHQLPPEFGKVDGERF